MRFLGAGGKMGFGRPVFETFYLGGTFTTVIYPEGYTTQIPGLIAEFNPSTDEVVDLGYTPSTSQNIRHINVGPTDIVHVLSGTFNSGTIQKWNGTSWTTIGTTNNYPDNVAEDSNGNVYVSGRFTTIDGITRTRVAKWDAAGATWGNLGSGLNNSTWVCTVDENDNAYFGGQFTDAGGIAAADRVAKWNGTAWSAMGSGANNTVRAIVSDMNGNIYIGGLFTSPSTRIAKWNGTAWSGLGSGMNGTVFALAVDPTNTAVIYAGGQFTTAGGVTANRIAKWNGTAWSAMGSGFNSGVYSISVDDNGNVYVSGTFTALGDSTTTVGKVVTWNGSNWENILPNEGFVDKQGNLDHLSNGNLIYGSVSNYDAPINFVYQPFYRFLKFRNNTISETPQ